jgi:preprotein translocase subunit YajC
LNSMFSFLSIVMFSNIASAQEAAAQPPAFLQFLPMIVLMVLMYFLLIRPQVKKQKEHQKFVTELKRGDEVITNGGILGRIEGMTDTVITLEVSDGVRLKILRSQIAGSSKTALETKKS